MAAADDDQGLMPQMLSEGVAPASLFAPTADGPAARSAPSTLTVRRAIAWHGSLLRATLARETTDRLVADGDARIALADDGKNRYGCGAEPDPTLFEFGSSTASVVSAHAFAAAAQLTARLSADPSRVALELAAIRNEIMSLTGASSVVGSQVVVVASGTDLHLIASHLAAAEAPLGSVTVEASETGTGVLPALAMKHFGHRTPRGAAVLAGTPLDAEVAASVQSVRLRHADGSPREASDIDADFERHVEAIVASGLRCLLSLTDLTKTGLLAPSIACASRLQARHAGRLEVLVDACQFRLAPATVCSYLRRGFMVAITGSKFVSGPAFCGALLLPPAVAHAARGLRLDRLAGYTARGDWPADWRSAEALDPSHNIGVMTRWRAALAELQRFRAVSDVMIARDLEAFADAIVTRLANDPAFEALPAPPIQRGNRVAAWDETPTMFSFIVHKPSNAPGRAPLSISETAALQAQMRHAVELRGHPDAASRAIARMRFQLGQPVACGMRHGAHVSALRVCASARMVADAALHADGIAPAIRQAMRAFDKLALLAGWSR